MSRCLRNILFFCCLLFPSTAFLQEKKADYSLRLANGIVKLSADTLALKQHLAHNKESLIYIKLDHSAYSQARSNNSLQFQDYIGDHTYSVIVSQNVSFPLHLIQGWAQVTPRDKISNQLAIAPRSNGSISLLVSVKKGLARKELEDMLSKLGGNLALEQQWKAEDIWEIGIEESQLETLAADNRIRFINPRLTDQPLNNQAIGFTNTQAAHQPVALGGHNLSGEGITVGVGDDSDPNHIDYIDRLTSFNPRLNTDHGFHTTGTVGSAGIKDERYEGFAPKANLISHYFSGIFAYAPTLAADFDMRITNNSYGAILGNCSYAGTYDIYSQFLDQQANELPGLLNVFAAGNDGTNTCTPFARSYATVAGAYQSAKNVLTVANIGKSHQLRSSGSSRGPVKDGRLKPEITAIGLYVVSTGFDNTYFPQNGTSMACPNVAGASALLYQRYKQLHDAMPDAALIKAALMNGATETFTPGPDYRNGFGIMNIGHSLEILDSNRHFQGSINTGEEQTFSISIPANVAQAKVMLYWADADASPTAAKALVNDLDMTVTGPDATVKLPLVLNPAPGFVENPAVEGEDHLNNVEQVTWNSPAGGSYTVSVTGTDIPVADQSFYVVYDFVKQGVAMQFPFGGEALPAGDSMFVYWNGDNSTSTFSLSYSSDNGANWNLLQNDIADSVRSYIWFPPADLTSTECLVRVIQNSTGLSSTSGKFALMGRPVATLAAIEEQCPGSVKFNWNTVTGATGYKVYLKEGPQIVEKATLPASQLSYQFHGLAFDTEQWVAVAPVKDGVTGMRSVAIARTPSDGSCTGLDTDGDLALSAIVTPVSGRQLTSTALNASETVTVNIKNLDNIAASAYRLSYQVNEGTWISQDFTTAILPAGNATRTITMPVDLSSPGNYLLKVAVRNLAITDPVAANDTLSVLVKSIANEPTDIAEGYEELFEAVTALNTRNNTVGIDGAEKWDFTRSNNKGRVRNFVNSDVLIEGTSSLSLDNAGNQRYDIEGSSLNDATATFNLATYDVAGLEIRCEFDYRLHGKPKFTSGNQVWVRGNDLNSWLPVMTYDTSDIGTIKHSGSLSFNDFLLANGQSFSTSTQVKISQRDTSMISASDYGNGLTIDNFRVYGVTNDVQLLSVDSLPRQSCGLSNMTPMRVRVRNTVFYTLYNIDVSYQLDDLSVITETIDSIGGKDTAYLTFATTMDLSEIGPHTVSAWVHLPEDSYFNNDSLLNIQIQNQPVITEYPYLEDFESSDGYLYATGSNISWEYGTPASLQIDHAASGSKAWKTNLDGNYNQAERSYLNSPCFNISSLSNPTLSFSFASDIESPADGSVFDMGWMEYSNDGEQWQKLGAVGEGYNWYPDSVNAWLKNGETYWHVATTALPKTGDIIMFRWVLEADNGAEFEGLAIDDIHVYDLSEPIYATNANSPLVNVTMPANGQYKVVTGGNIFAEVTTGADALGNVGSQAFRHSFITTDAGQQYILPASFVLKSNATITDPVTLKLYVTDEAMQQIRNDISCGSCPPTDEVYQLGITQFSHANKDFENGELQDNKDGTYSYIKAKDVRWVPYDVGYYAEVPVSRFSEFWFNDGGPTKDQPLEALAIDFSAIPFGARTARLDWTSYIDTAVSLYELERADSSLAFAKIFETPAISVIPGNYMRLDTPAITGPLVHYRLHYQLNNGTWFYSPIRTINWEGTRGNVAIYPNPVRNGILTITWFKGNDAALQWSLTDILGRKSASGILDGNPYSGNAQLNMGNMGLSSGIYLLKVVSDGENWEFKIVYQ